VISLRYHAVSIAAVFLALAVGVVLGASGVSDRLLSAVSAERDDLDGQLRALSAERDDLAAGVRAADEFALRVGPAAVRGQLDGRSVVLVTAGAEPADRDAVTALVVQELIGGRNGAVTRNLQSSDVVLDATNRVSFSGNALLLNFSFAVAPDKFESAYPALNDQLDSLAGGGFVNEALLKDAKRNALQTLQLRAEDRQAQLQTIAGWWAMGLHENAPAYRTAVEGVTSERVRDFMRRYLQSRPSVRVLVVSPAVQAAYKTDRVFTAFEDVDNVTVAFERNGDAIVGDANQLNAVVQFVRINDARRVDLHVNQDAAERDGLVKRRYVQLYRRLVEAGLTEAQMDNLRAGLYVRRGKNAAQQSQNQLTNLRYNRD